MTEYVTQRALTGALLAIATIGGAAVAWAWNVHTEHPHANAVHVRELDRVFQQLDRFEQNMAARLDRVQDDVAGVRELIEGAGGRSYERIR